ncbi:MAG: hypothetical protein N2C14_33935, partial [Planctomycetales bacterium]
MIDRDNEPIAREDEEVLAAEFGFKGEEPPETLAASDSLEDRLYGSELDESYLDELEFEGAVAELLAASDDLIDAPESSAA